jgi:hypothetical protein
VNQGCQPQSAQRADPGADPCAIKIRIARVVLDVQDHGFALSRVEPLRSELRRRTAVQKQR